MGRSKLRKKPDEPRLRPDLKRRALDVGTLHGHLERGRTEPLGEEAYLDLKQAVDTLAFLNQEVERKGASLDRLRHVLFGPRTESTSTVCGEAGPAGGEKDARRKPGAKVPGHGRNGARADPGARKEKVPREGSRSGDPCPSPGCEGKI